MNWDEKTPFDRFKTVGELSGERRRRTALSGWLWIIAGAAILGMFLGGLLYFTYMLGLSSPEYRRGGLISRSARRAELEHPTPYAVVKHRLKLFTLAGGGIGLVVGCGYCMISARRERQAIADEEQR